MDFDLAQLRALDAAVSEGTFEAAARALHLTPSAISQRVRGLEMAAGRVLLVRSKPVAVTSSGHAVLRLARSIGVLTADAVRELGSEDAEARPMTLSIAVNADSLATWVLTALSPLAGAMCFDIHREDEEHTGALLREGKVMGAITIDSEPVPGCTCTRLGTMVYRVMASPTFADRWFAHGVTTRALARAPAVIFDRKDDLQHRYLRRRSRAPLDPPVHVVPSSADFLAAVRFGFGWGMLPEMQTTVDRREGNLIDVDPQRAADVVLHWQQWRLRSPSLDRLAGAIVDAARVQLKQPRRRRGPEGVQPVRD